MPNQIVDFDTFVIWRANGENYGTDLFICSHGGYDQNDGTFKSPDYGTGKPGFYFYGPHGQSITEGQVNVIIAARDLAQFAKSIMGPGLNCWNYILAEYKRDWFDAATKYAKQTKDQHQVLHGCLMIKASSQVILLRQVIQTIQEKGIKYLNNHYMACRTEV